MAHEHNINPGAARALVADIRKVWPTASILDWVNETGSNDRSFYGSIDGPAAGQLFDPDGEHLVCEQSDQIKLQKILDRHSRALGWHEADPDSVHSLPSRGSRCK